MMVGANYWPAVVGNLRKTWKSWARISRILDREGAGLRITGIFFKAVFQAVFIFGS